MMISFTMDKELADRIMELARELGFSRSHLCRALLRGAMYDTDGLERWKHLVSGPHFKLCDPNEPNSSDPTTEA